MVSTSLCKVFKGLSAQRQSVIMIPLGKEFEQLQAYIDIQKIKYANRFEAILNLKPDLLDYEVPKLIIQPFVENALKHAWYGDRLTIWVTGRRTEDRIIITIMDNGVGMKAERLPKLTEDRQQGGGCGIRNVHDRIRLRYGADYGVNLISTYGVGTTVEISIPYEEASLINLDKDKERGNTA